MVPPPLRQYLSNAGIQVDVMNTVSRFPSLWHALPHTTHAAKRMLNVQLAC